MNKLGKTGLGLLALALTLPAASGVAAADPMTDDSSSQAAGTTGSGPAADGTTGDETAPATDKPATDTPVGDTSAGDGASDPAADEDSAPTGDVTATGCSGVVGADQLSSTITTFSGTDPESLTAGSSYRMNITGALANGHCAGDTISVRIDSPLQGNANASYPIYSSDGALAGQLTVNGDGTAATLTLNDWVSAHRDVHLDAYLAVRVGSTDRGTRTVTWTVDGTTYTKPVSPADAPCTNCDTMPTWVSKWGDYTQNEGPANDTIRVVVQLPTTTAETTTFTVTDEIDSEGQRFSCVEGDLGWRYYTSLNPDGGVADGASTETGLSRTDTSVISVAQSSCTDTTFTAAVTIHGTGIASRLYVPLLVTDETRTEFPDKVTVASDQGFTGSTSAEIRNNRGGGILDGDDMTPGVEITKKDAAGNDAESETEAVDLTQSQGATSLVLTITNTGTERLRDVTVSDALTRGAGTVSNLDCDFSQADPEAPTSGTAWAGPFLIGKSFTCTADLSGVTGEIHEDVASVDATGWFTGGSVRSSNGYHAKATAPTTPTAAPSGPASSGTAPGAPATTPTSTSPAPHRSTGLPRTGADGAVGLATLALTGLGITAAIRHRRR